MNGKQCSPSVRAGWLAVAALFALLSAGGAGRAAVRYVNKNAPGPAHDGTSWTTAFTAVQEAVNSAAVADEVWVATSLPGALAYVENVSINKQIALYGGFAGNETSRNERDWKANPTVLDGGGDTVVSCASPGYVGVLLDGFAVRNGGFNFGVYVSSGKATVTNSTLSGSLYGADTNGTATAILTNNTFSGNRTGVNVFSGTMTLRNNNIIGNREDGIIVSGTATLVNNTITANGAGVKVSSGRASMTNNIVAFNASGVVNYGSLAIFTHNDVYGNTATDYYNFTPPSGQGNLSLAPQLSNAYHDIHLRLCSPCIDAGLDSAVTSGDTDFEGQSRIEGAHVDIGSDESDGADWTVPSLVFHVATTGDDSRDGLSWPTAKRTAGAALSVAQGSDEVWVKQGTYPEVVSVPPGVSLYGGFTGSETSREQRDWTAYPTILDGGGSTSLPVVECNFVGIVVDGFTLRKGAYGVRVYGLATLENNIVTGNNQQGVSVTGIAVLTNNSISSNGQDGVYVNGTGTLTGNTITGNVIGVSVFYGEASLANNTLRGNTGAVLIDTSTVHLTNNTISANGYAVLINGGQTALMNNTLSGNGIEVYDGTASLTNNIVAFGRRGIYRSGGSITPFSHNDVYGNTNGDFLGYTPPDGQGNTSVDPLFENRANNDFHLQPGSPCIDAGDDSVVKTGDRDLDGKPRIIGSHVDMGAYEYGALTPPFSLTDVTKCLSIASGLTSGSAGDVARLDVEPPPVTGYQLDIRDAIRLARKVAGLEANP